MKPDEIIIDVPRAEPEPEPRMTDDEVKSHLCQYDKRRPDYDPMFDDRERHDGCFCDPCFYGRDRLAREILRERGIS